MFVLENNGEAFTIVNPAPLITDPIKSKMVMAGDELQHSLSFGRVSQHWLLENKNGLVRIIPNFIRGLSELERVSKIPADKFLVTENPYG